MVKRRLYVGNLSAEISDSDLRSKFSNFGQIDDLEVKAKNGSHFAFISVDFPHESKAQEAIELLNSTKWRGSYIKVQIAKESFLDKLKREQQQASQQDRSGSFTPRQPRGDKVATSIISFEDNVEGSVIPVAAATPKGSGRPKNEASSDSDSDTEGGGLLPFKGIFAYPELSDKYEPAVLRPDEKQQVNTKADGTDSAFSKPHAISWKDKQTSKLVPDSNYQETPRQSRKKASKEFREPAEPPVQAVGVQNKLLSIAGISLNDGSRPSNQRRQPERLPRWKERQGNEKNDQSFNSGGSHSEESKNRTGVLDFKKRNSDLLRQKSLDSRTATLQAQKDLIKSSLAAIKIPPPNADGSIPPSVAGKRKLFDDENDDEGLDEEISFKPRRQFEGKSGALNLELSSKLASYDSRFKLDERFRDEDESKEESTDSAAKQLQQEKEANFAILTDILGNTEISAPKEIKTPNAIKDPLSSVIVSRYDPEAEEEATSELEKSAMNKKKKSKKENLDVNHGEDGVTESEASNLEKPSYFVASNLKDLFSDGAAQSGGFSVLKTFGTASPVKEEIQNSSMLSINGKKRQNQNGLIKSDCVRTGYAEQAPSNGITINTANVKFNMAKRVGFFYTPNDKRFEGLKDYFLGKEEKMEDVVHRFNSNERNELKLICKGKIKNTKRKSEKRTLILKRLKRQKQAKKFNEKKIEGSNAVPLGGRIPVV